MIPSSGNDLVDRAIDLFPAPTDARERLTRRRARQQRKRRLTAGAVGGVVALTTAALLARSIESAHVPADRTPPSPAPGVPGALAYALDGDVYIADPDASNPVKIAVSDESCDGSVGSQMPTWSPDGRYLAFQRGCFSSDPSGVMIAAAIVISDPEGAVISEFPMDVQGEFSWSPDSTRIAVWENFGQQIGVYGVDGVRQTLLPSPLTGNVPADGPQWLQDGSALLVSDYRPPSSMVLPLDGSPAYEYSGELPNTLWASPSRERLSPDGQRSASINQRGELIVRDVASGKVTVLTEAKASLPAGAWLNVVRGFSPQGDRILYAVFVRDGYNNLYSIGVGGSDPRRLVVGAMQGQWRPS